MASHPDIRDAVDAFLSKDKTLAGIPGWRRDTHERVYRWTCPLEVDGELHGLDLAVKAYPRSRALKFRVVLTYGKAIWRIDYANDTPRVNSFDRPNDLELGPITGPHYHCWADNRRFATMSSLSSNLHNARVLPQNLRTFERTFPLVLRRDQDHRREPRHAEPAAPGHTPMTVLEAVTSALASWPNAIEDEAGIVRVPTQCLYPSNDVVMVIVEGGADTYRVHDDGGALEELDAAGGIVPYPLSIMRAATRQLGVRVSEVGTIFAPFTRHDGLAASIVLVANASKYAAHRLIEGMKPRPRRSFRDALERLLETEFGHDPVRKASAVAGAHKRHKFDYVISVGHQRQLLLDGVTPEASAINAAVVAHLDVRQANPPNIVQRIVYDDEEKWKAEDLSLLSVGAPVVPFSRAREVLRRIAA